MAKTVTEAEFCKKIVKNVKIGWKV